ncbi:MAG: YcaO-like family protein, partial [Algicola sp.]|nr:YcaO-like family protein [Algicola sp.]
PVWSLATQYQHYVPLSFCYANSPFEEQQYSRFYHNGGSAGNTLEEAVLQGFLEIIERDAVAVWWYNRLQRPGIDFADMNGDLLIQLEHTLAGDWQYWALDLTHDFNIPVVAAISRHKTRHTFCFGFGCHLDVQIACQRAFTELCQITEIRDNNVAPFDFDQIPVGDYLFASTGGTQRFSDFQSPKNTDIKADIEYCVTQAVRLKLDPLVLNYSRPDMLLKTAKVIIPGSCHIFPYLAAARLYTVPVSMGWLAEAKTEAQLNPQALLI